jgi:hypothetical protein
MNLQKYLPVKITIKLEVFMNRLYVSSLTSQSCILLLLYVFFLPCQLLASNKLHYQVERFSPHAHRMMDDHGVNAVYSVFINHTNDYLTNTHFLKNKGIILVNKYIKPARTVVKFVRHHTLRPDPVLRHADPYSFFSSLRQKIPYTYVILQDRMIFTESTAKPNKEVYKDKMSKHYLISGLKPSVYFAGEMRIYKNTATKELFLVFDNASGTYQPTKELLPNLKKLLTANFKKHKKIFFITKSYDQNIDKNRLFAHKKKPFMNL